MSPCQTVADFVFLALGLAFGYQVFYLMLTSSRYLGLLEPHNSGEINITKKRTSTHDVNASSVELVGRVRQNPGSKSTNGVDIPTLVPKRR